MATITGNGQINGTDDADLITGGSAGDTIIGNGGNDTIDGGGGFNFVAYWTSPSGVGVQLFSSEAVTDGLGGHDTLINIQGVIGSGFDDFIMGSSFTDVLIGLSGNDFLSGLDGDDVLVGGAGNDTIDGGNGSDKALYSGNRADYTVTATVGGFTITDNRAGADNEGSDTISNVEAFQFANGTLTAADVVAGTNLTPNTTDNPTPPPTTTDVHFSVFRDGSWSDVTATPYSGPVNYLQYQFLGSASGEVAIGTAGNDFINLLGGDDAANGGAGNDVLDGGLGSNFLTGGAGTDVFFLDGRSGQVTWSTITDWEAGEQLSLWGWRPGVSHATWVSNAGTAGFQGATMHADLDGNGSIDASVTWTGITQAQLPSAIEMDGLLWIK